MRRAAAVAAAALCLQIIAGCSLAPEYRRPDVDVAPAFRESAPTPAAATSATVRADWWTAYGDPVLDALQAKVDAANPDLAAAVARYAQARAYLDQTRSGLFPQLGVGAAATRNRQSDDRPLRSAAQPAEYADENLGAQLGYELDLWGRVRNLVAAGRAGAQASAADLAAVRLSLHAELANDYITLRTDDAELALLADTAAAYAKSLALTQNRLSGGIASGLDVARARTQLDTARALESDVRAQRALLEHAIASLTGATASAFSLPPSSAPLALPQIPPGVPATLLERRPDVAAAERRLAAANAGIGVARAAMLPDIVLGAAAGYESSGATNWLSAPNSFWSIGPRISLPVFDAGRRRAIEAQAQGLYDEAAAHYRSTAIAAFQQVEDELARLHWFGEEAKDEDAAAESARQALDLAMDRYRNGAVNYLEVVDAQVTALSAQRTQLALRDRELRASVGLVRALGGGWSAADGAGAGQRLADRH